MYYQTLLSLCVFELIECLYIQEQRVQQSQTRYLSINTYKHLPQVWVG